MTLLLSPQLCLAATATTAQLSLAPSGTTAGSSLTLTATVNAGASTVTSGTVFFCNGAAAYCLDSAYLGQAQLTASGSASLAIVPPIGTRSYRAVYKGTATYGASTSSIASNTITGTHPTSTVLSSSGSAGSYTLAAQVASSGNLTASPTGTVNFTDSSNAGYSLGSAPLGAGVSAQTFPITTSNFATTTPRRSAAGDFNGDGIPDIIVASQSDNDVTVLLGHANGTFTAAPGSPYATGLDTVAVASGDFNNDGKLDIVAVNHDSQTVSILLGNGNGTFQSAVNVTGLYNISAIAVADFNRDGKLDVVVTTQGGNGVYVLFGNGDGTLTYSNYYATGSGPYSVVAQDLNGDGYPDLVVGNGGANSVAVLLGSSSGTFTAAPGSPFTTGPYASAIALVDLNGDGRPDLVAGNDNVSSISVLAGKGDGTFAAYTSWASASGSKQIAVGDFNSDGKQDVALCFNNSSIGQIFFGNGDETLQSPLTIALGGSGCGGIVAADFNGDGLPDIEVTGQGNHKSTILLNTFAQTATASVTAISIPGSGTHNITAAYVGDATDSASTSAAVPLTATRSATSLSLSAAPASPAAYGQQLLLTASLSPNLVGAETSNGETISFLNNGLSVGTGTLASGFASLIIPTLPAGTNSLTAVYPTDANFLSSTSAATSFTVVKATPVLTWAAQAPISYGTALSAAQLNASSGSVAGLFTYTPPAGTILSPGSSQVLSVLFTPSDSADYKFATASTTLSVTQATPSILLSSSATPAAYGSTITLAASILGGGSGTVTFFDGGTSIGTAPVIGNLATLATASLAVGTHSLTASWPGNANYTAGHSTALTQVISRTPATITEFSTLNPSGYGDSIMISIALTGPGAPPTGTVVLTYDAITVGTATLNASGSAAIPAPLLTAGTHTFVATYLGDSNYF